MQLKSILVACSMLLFSQISIAQLSSGSSTPDFTLEDLNGTTHNLYSILASGRGAVLDFSATWCGPCWNYHHSGNLDAVWNNFGPGATDEMMVFMIEADPSTSQPCIYGPSGCSGGSIGDWTAGTSYPILNPPASGASQVNNDFAIGYWPTLYAVGPNYKIYLIGQVGFSTWATWVESFRLKADYVVTGDQCSPSRTIDLQPVGGYGNRYYNWSNGATTEDITSAAPGDYYVTITDDHDYDVEIGPITVGSSQNMEINLESYADVDCFGDESGYLDISVTGGSGSLAYEWSNGETSEDIYNLSGGNYEVYVTDLSTGCQQYAYYTIFEYAPLEALIQTTSSGCDGMSGQATVIPGGGNSPYSFLYEGSYTATNQVSSLETGMYSIIVEDASGCTEEFPFEIEAEDLPKADLNDFSHLNCTNPMTTVTADSSSVGMNIVYNWYVNDTMLVDTGYQIQLDSAAVYMLEVLDINNMCVDTSSFELEQDFALPNASAGAMENIDCTTALVEVSGVGSSNDINHIYNWTSPMGTIESDPSQLNIDVSAGGSYILAVTDTLNGCISVDTAEVMEFLEGPEVELLSLGSIDCINANTNISVNEEANMEYNWNSNNGIILSQNNGTVNVGAAGNYMIEVTNTETGCVTQEEYVVEESTDLPEVNAEDPASITCMINSTPVQVNYNDEYEYNWSTANGAFEATNDPNVILVSAGGSYLVDVTNTSNGCMKSVSIMVPENTEEPSAAVQEIQQITCLQNTPQIILENKPNYSYEWSTFDGNIVNGGNSSTVSVDLTGEYIVSILNNENGCVSEMTYSVAESTDTPDLSLINSNELNCNNATAVVQVNHNDNYNYQWLDQDGNDLNLTGAEVSLAQEGMFTVIATDNTNGCSNALVIELEGNFEQPSVNLLNLEEFDCSGAGGIIEVEANPDYNYSWSTQDGMISAGANTNAISVAAGGIYILDLMDTTNGCSTQLMYEVEANNVAPQFALDGPTFVCGNETISICVTGEQAEYIWSVDGVVVDVEDCLELSTASIVSVEAMGDNGCSSVEFLTVSQVNMEQFDISSSADALDCVTDQMTLTPDLQNANFIYEWFDTNGDFVSNQMEIVVGDVGMYSLNIIDETSGCAVSNEFTVEEDDTVSPVSDFTVNDDELSFQFDDLSTGEYDNIIWDFGDGGVSSNQNPLHIYDEAGYYTVCLTVSNKCGDSVKCVDIVAAAALQAQTELNHVTCNGYANGSLDVVFDGGIMPYQINWTGPNGFTSSDLMLVDLEIGDYTLNITDDSGMEFTEVYTITEPEAIKVTPTITDSDLDNKGSINLTIAGGTGDYTVVWDNGEEGIFITDLNPGDYVASIVDENGCETIETYTVGGITDVNEIELINELTIAPNPASEFINVKISADSNESFGIEIHSLLGQIVYTNQVQGSQINYNINLDNISGGVYIMVIRNAGKIASKRIVISK